MPAGAVIPPLQQAIARTQSENVKTVRTPGHRRRSTDFAFRGTASTWSGSARSGANAAVREVDVAGEVGGRHRARAVVACVVAVVFLDVDLVADDVLDVGDVSV